VEGIESRDMKIANLLKPGHPAVSFEFFPPKTEEGFQSLVKTAEELKSLNPSYVSITYGAGGSTRQKTLSLVSKIKRDIGIEAAAHLTCVGHSKGELAAILDDLARSGVENILALRGDPPQGQTAFVPNPEGFQYASELVAFIRERHSFSVGVAGYPEKHVEAPSWEEDMRNLKHKVSAGADFIVTQLFFNNPDFFKFRNHLATMGVHVPVIAGIMPITDFDQIKRFAKLCGASIPEKLKIKLESANGDKNKIVQLGIEHAIEQCRELLEKNVAGIHFYTLNKSQSTREIVTQLKIEKRILQ
jgi:methylenetetrahydrofolate reductase (NADPH)